jgi:hypothetical protein
LPDGPLELILILNDSLKRFRLDFRAGSAICKPQRLVYKADYAVTMLIQDTHGKADYTYDSRSCHGYTLLLLQFLVNTFPATFGTRIIPTPSSPPHKAGRLKTTRS